MSINLLGSASSSFSWQPMQLDLSSLITPIDTTAIMAAQAAKKFTTPAVIAPWAEGVRQEPQSALVSRALARKTLIDTSSEIRGAKGNEDLKSLFAMYKALDTLKAIADQAASKTIGSAMREKLDARFQAGLEEIRAFAASSGSSQVQLLFGEKKSQLETIAVPKTPRIYEGIGVTAAEPTTAVPGLTGTETFSLKLSKSTATDEFTIDLSKIQGTKSLNAIVREINKQIETKVMLDNDGKPMLNKDGEPYSVYQTRAEVYQGKDGKYGIRFNGTSVETITLSDPATKPSLFVVAGIKQDGKTPVANLRRVDNVTDTMTVPADSKVIAGIDTEATQLAEKVAEKKKPLEIPGMTITPPDNTVYKETTARNAAVDSQGFIYVVGTSSGDFGSQQGGDEKDLFLTKYAPDGSVVFSRVIGSGKTTEGYSVAVDKNDNVIVAGSTEANLATGSALSGQDSFVTRFSSDGTEQFTVQLDRVAVDAATAVTTDDAGNIYIAGKVKGTIANGVTVPGGEDIFVAKIDGGKRVVEGVPSRLMSIVQFGTSGNDSVADIAIGPDGELLVAGTENGRAVVRKLDSANMKTELGKVDLGDLGGGTVTGIAVDETTGAVAVVGSTRSGSLSAGTATGSFSGATDGFLARLDANLNAQGVTYLGTTGTDKIGDVVAKNGEFYVTGSTTGIMAGEAKKGFIDTFVSRVDAATGTVETSTQFGTVGTETSGGALVFNPHGRSNTLAKLGLRTGVLNPAQSTDLMSQTSLRPGDHFYISVGSSTRKVTIEQGDTYERLAKRIRTTFPLDITVNVSSLSKGTSLQIKAKGDKDIVITAGKGEQDALEKLGLAPTKLLNADKLYGIGDESEKNVEDALNPGGAFALGLDMSLGLPDAKAASYVSGVIGNAMETVKRAYRSLYYDPTKAELAQQAKMGGAVPAHLTKQLANYQDALARLGGL